MKPKLQSAMCRFCAHIFWVTAAICLGNTVAYSTTGNLDDLLAHTGTQVVGFLDQFSDVKCTEQVQQEKLRQDGKVELKEESTYDYLVILTNTGGELSLDESRLAVHESETRQEEHPAAGQQRVRHSVSDVPSLLRPEFQIRIGGGGDDNGRRLVKVSFQHIPGTRSPAPLALRGREYPLELSGMAWIEPQTGVINRIEAGVENTMEDIGLKSLHSEVEFAPVPFAAERNLLVSGGGHG